MAVATIFVLARYTGVALTVSAKPEFAGYLSIATPVPPAPLVPPLQQHIELAKAGQGKDSEVIQKLTQSTT